MLLETFHGSDLRVVLDDARHALGEDALIVRSRVERHGKRSHVEVVAADPEKLNAVARRLQPPTPPLAPAAGGRARRGPFVLALVGPTGSGKSTTLVKLAMHPRTFQAATVGLVTLDTFRVGALEHLQQYAEIAGIRLEVAWDAREVPDIMKRLDGCDVVLIDTPGRSPRARDANTQWQELLRAFAPSETHLVLPATMRPELVATTAKQFIDCRLTHMLVTRCDELGDDTLLADSVGRVDLPLRWLGDGQGVPEDLQPARARILNALGIRTTEPAGRAAA